MRGKIIGVLIIAAGVITIVAEALFIHDFGVLALGVVNVVGGIWIIVSSNRLIQVQKETKIVQAAAEEAIREAKIAMDELTRMT